MPNPFIGVRIPTELNEAMTARVHETGQSKSEIVIEALKSYLGLSSYQERLTEIEQRLSVIEAAINANAPDSLERHQDHHSAHHRIIEE
ncbi:MAG: hypothetical protein ACFB4I_06705 [Cyanophyceae cyanobacterium]